MCGSQFELPPHVECEAFPDTHDDTTDAPDGGSLGVEETSASSAGTLFSPGEVAESSVGADGTMV